MAEEVAEKRGRGRPAGYSPGKRSTVWGCAAIKEGKIILERITPPDNTPADLRASFTIADAEKIFMDQHGVKPEIIGPFHDKKGGQKAESSKKKTISVNLAELSISDEKYQAIYQNWKGVAHLTKEDNQCVFFIGQFPIDKNEKGSPPMKLLNISDVKKVEKVLENTIS